MKNELNKANRVIASELGDDFDIDKVLMQKNTWKGRAQKIGILTQKIKRLNDQLGMSRMDMSGMSGISGFTDMKGMSLGMGRGR